MMPAIHVIKSVLLLAVLAGLASAPAGATPPGETDSNDVTITVVSDPEQLNEKVNRISLPPAVDEHARTSPKPEKPADQGKEDHDAQESAAQKADGTQHDAGNSAHNDTEDAKQDVPEAPQQSPNHSEDTGER